MRRNYALLFFVLILLSFLSGILTSGVTFIGRVGINTIHKEYKFFKIWWQAALMCFAAMLLILIILYYTDRYLNGSMRRIVMLIFLCLFIIGLYFTYNDFHTDLSHQLLGKKFHLGVYLYWLGFSITSLFFVLTKKKYENIKSSLFKFCF